MKPSSRILGSLIDCPGVRRGKVIHRWEIRLA